MVPVELPLEQFDGPVVEEPGLGLPGFGGGEGEELLGEVELAACQPELFGPAEAGQTGEFGGLTPFLWHGLIQLAALVF